MNKRGNSKSLVASQPGNLNAAKQGVHSPRLIQVRAAEIESELTQSFEFSPAERLAVHEAARCIAILEAIDRDLDQRGLVDKEGQPRYLLNHRSRTSRRLEQWLEKVQAAIERKAASEQAPSRADFPDRRRSGSIAPMGVSEPSPGPSGSEAEAVYVNVVPTEPVPKAAVRDAHRSEDLTACPDRRRQRFLDVLE